MGDAVKMIVVPAGSALVAGGLAWGLARLGWRVAMWALIVAIAAGFFWLTYLARAAEGWGAMGFAIMALVLALPGFLGACLGGWIGTLTAKR